MTGYVRAQVSTLAHGAPVAALPGDTLRGVAHRMWAESVGALVVGDVRRPLGIVSERDVVSALAQGADPDTMTAAQAMTGHVIAIRPDDPVLDAASHMLDDAIRHLPLVDPSGTVVGVLSVRDLLRPLLLDALGGDRTGEAAGRGGTGGSRQDEGSRRT